MTRKTKAQIRSVWVTLAPYIGAVILDIALCALLVYSGKELSVEAILAVTGCVGALLFFHKRGGDGGSMIAGGGSLIAAALILAGCSGQACQTESTVVSALDAGIEASAGAVGDVAGEDWDITLGAARSAVDLGHEAVNACEAQRDRAGWQTWVELALRSAGAVASFIDLIAGPEDLEVPPELDHAIGELEAEQERVE